MNNSQEEHKANDDAKIVSKKETFWQAIKFTLLSISAGGIEALSFALLTQLTPLDYDFRQVISVVLSVIWNFTLNRRYTFKSANNVPIAMTLVGLFYVAFIPATAYLGQLATDGGTNDYIIKGITMVLNFILEFLWWKFVVFRGTENTNSLSKQSKH